MSTRIAIGDIAVEVVWKAIKNVHLSVHPPTGRVRISAPLRTSLDTIRIFAISKRAWIRRHQQKMQVQERETPREYLDRESHYVWGRRYLLSVVEADAPVSVDLQHSRLVLRVKPGTDLDRRCVLLEEWYRQQLKAAVPPMIAEWEPRLGVKVNRFYTQRMKTKWGSCNPKAQTLRLNTELAKKPRECLEYVVVHEMLHLLEPTHNARFVALMDQYLPRWTAVRQALNRLPVGYETWLE